MDVCDEIGDLLFESVETIFELVVGFAFVIRKIIVGTSIMCIIFGMLVLRIGRRLGLVGL